MSGGSAPAPPDYVGAAKEQGQANLDAARLAAQLNRANIAGPSGSVKYTEDPNNPDSWTQTTTLAPEQQAIYDNQALNQNQTAILAQSKFGSLYGSLNQPFTVNGPDRVSSVTPSSYKTDIDAPSVANSSVNLSSVAPLTTDYSGDVKKTQDAIYGIGAQRLDDQFGRSDEDLRTRLLNSGIREGSAAWTNAMHDQAVGKNDAYANLNAQSIQAGNDEQARLYNEALQGRQQGVGEEFNKATFGNTAAEQQFQNEMARAGLYNTTQDQTFGQGQQNAQLANAVRQAALSEAQTTRELPLQEYMSLYNGTGAPQTGAASSIPQVSGPQPADILGATGNQFNANLGQYNADQARQQSNISTGVSALSTIAAIYF